MAARHGPQSPGACCRHIPFRSRAGRYRAERVPDTRIMIDGGLVPGPCPCNGPIPQDSQRSIPFVRQQDSFDTSLLRALSLPSPCMRGEYRLNRILAATSTNLLCLSPETILDEILSGPHSFHHYPGWCHGVYPDRHGTRSGATG